VAVSDVVRVGTRGSALARRQTDQVLDLLRARHPELEFAAITVRTHGDANANAPLAGMSPGVFVKEIEQQLQSGQLDLAVHSLKDLPTQLPDGLTIGAVLEREDPRDVQVNRWNCPLSALPPEARMGTSSPRRASQLKHNCPQAMVVPIRGNVETRLTKARGDECDGAVLAAAGLVRLGLTGHITEYLPPQKFVPPPGQGVLAVEVREDQPHIADLLRSIEHAATRQAIVAERAYLEALGGGCQVPVGAYAAVEAERLTLNVFVGSADGARVFGDTLQGSIHRPAELAARAFQALLEQGAGELPEMAQDDGR
jgi:hydroxymethylbilane synthase